MSLCVILVFGGFCGPFEGIPPVNLCSDRLAQAARQQVGRAARLLHADRAGLADP